MPSSRRSVAKLSPPSNTLSRHLPNATSASPPKRLALQFSYRPTVSEAPPQVAQNRPTSSTSLRKTVAGRKASNMRSISSTTTIPILEVEHNQDSNQVQPLYTYTSFDPRPKRIYIRTVAEANRALEGINGPVGFDMEWRVLFRRVGPQTKAIMKPVAVVQIANRGTIIIIQTSAMKGKV
jgi:hypothetical protein